jgi:hypothetical protein
MKAIINTHILDTRFNTTYIITSVTDKRVNLDEIGCKYTTSTGRSSSKFYVGHSSFENNIESGVWRVVKG